MSNGTEPWESSVEEPTRPRKTQGENIITGFGPVRRLVKDRGPKVDTTAFIPMSSGTAKQTVEIISFGDPVAQPGPYLPGAYEESGKDVDPRKEEEVPLPMDTAFENRKVPKCPIAKEYSVDLSVYVFRLNPTIVQLIVDAFLAGNNTGTFTLSVKRNEYGK